MSNEDLDWKRAQDEFVRQLHVSRRNTELVRKAERETFAPQYRDLWNEHGEIVRAIYLGHTRVLNRGITFPTLRNAQGRTGQFGPLTANISHLDLSRASDAQQRMWREV